MATTSLWHIKGRLKDLIAYVENPAKTNDPSLQDFFNVFSYAQNPNKTEQGNRRLRITERRNCCLGETMKGTGARRRRRLAHHRRAIEIE